jgi:hypothetical protein
MAATGGRRSLAAALSPMAGATEAPAPASAQVVEAPAREPAPVQDTAVEQRASESPVTAPVTPVPVAVAPEAVAEPVLASVPQQPPATPAPVAAPLHVVSEQQPAVAAAAPSAEAATTYAPVASPQPAPLARPLVPSGPPAATDYSRQAPPVAPARPLPRPQSSADAGQGDASGLVRRNQRPGKNAFRERKEVFLYPDQLDDLEQVAKRLKRARQGEGEPITANTLIRVAIDLLLQRGGEVTGRSERELLATLELRDRDDFGRFV